MREMAFEVRLDTPFEQSLKAVIAALKEEGFGVLTRVDIQNGFKENWAWNFVTIASWAPAIPIGVQGP